MQRHRWKDSPLGTEVSDVSAEEDPTEWLTVKAAMNPGYNGNRTDNLVLSRGVSLSVGRGQLVTNIHF